ncbi:MAG: single-stranded-DNA-specific exonuclease RecJ [Oscillospiraceae bacterium]|jgi:single-stranded-DNA-specific exonuclease|nr:single-stranded-DNA-specific exonuclease RecJ [Oscillospiraceae bacterium]
MKPFEEWEIGSYNAKEAELLQAETGSTRLAVALLNSRGFHTGAEATEFLRDDTGLLSDPMLLPDMDKALARIRLAKERGERVVVFGDYDVDGITATALLVSYLKSIDIAAEYYIPERLTEGYGISDESLHSIHKAGVQTLIVTVDCGVTAVEQAKLAAELGMEIVITDHHECPDVLPDVCAVVDPYRKDSEYPFTGLAGVGVAFKLVCALEGSERTEDMLELYGDLVAIGTIADIMPVTGENRAIVRRGIEVLRKGRRIGLLKLMEEANVPFREISGADLSFMLVPKLNAAGRMGQVHIAYDLITAEGVEEAHALATKLCALNNERREVENTIFTEICATLTNPAAPIVAASATWHHGVSGIVASRLADTYGVPAVVICIDGDEGRGSCRSFGNFSIFDALSAINAEKELLTTFGGHFHAAGLTLPTANIEEFTQKLSEAYLKARASAPGPMLKIDFAVENASLIQLDDVESLEKLAPWGPGNPPPILAITNAKIEQIFPIGGDRHIKLKLWKGGGIFDCVYFGMTPQNFAYSRGSYLDIAFEPVVNEFRGARSVQLIIRDARRTGAKAAPVAAPAVPAASVAPADGAAVEISQGAELPQPRKPTPYRPSEPLALITSFLGGAPLKPAERFLLRPSRDDFKAVWKLVTGNMHKIPTARQERVDRITKLAGLSNPAKTYTALKVFEQCQLLTLDENDGKLIINITPREGPKADLEACEIMKRLNEAPPATAQSELAGSV